MARLGFAVDPVPARYFEPSTENTMDRQFGVWDPDRVKLYGYGIAPSEANSRASESSVAQSETPAQQKARARALNGEDPDGGSVNDPDIPQGGCAGESSRALVENPGDDPFVFDLETKAGDQAEADDRVKEAFADWSKCMAETGYTYTNPGDPSDHFADINLDGPNADGTHPSTDEIQTAIADVNCRTQTHLIKRWSDVWLEKATAIVDENSQQLADVQKRLETAYRNAATVVADYQQNGS